MRTIDLWVKLLILTILLSLAGVLYYFVSVFDAEQTLQESTIVEVHPKYETTAYKSGKERVESAELVREEDTAEPFTIAFAGDTMFDWDLRDVLEDKGYDYPFEYVKDSFANTDYTVVNLESVITERNEKKPGQQFWIKSDEKGLEALKNSGVDMVNLGNNHMLDYGEQGLLDTLDAAQRLEMDYMGAGANETEAYKAKTIEINNQTVAFLSFTRFFPDFTWTAEADKPGVTNGYELDFVIEKIQEQQDKAQADYLIVNFHWGIEQTNIPADYQREYVKQICEKTETDAIVGSHPHWLQGFEFYNDVPVAYSLGNFLFPDYVSGPSAETGIFKLTFDNGEIAADFSPYIIESNQIQPLEGDQEQEIYEYLDEISINAKLDETGRITVEEG
ncbi:CapA family protein [Alteribacillus sp. HJP-4]|uniref:CapA family protein n=1 Tax=Alteribacillus sp. HJP-4 TaxID=2775394 RepID=UPI0035CCEB68